MDKQTLEQFKKQLEERKAGLIEGLESVGKRAQGEETNFDAEFPQYGDSAEDNATEVADYTKNLSLEKNLEKDLHGVERALKRIEDGEYGKCLHCDKDIETERLKVRPESNSCVECKKTLKGK